MTVTTKTVGIKSADWIRASLQVNPFEYEGSSSPSKKFDNELAYNEALLDECERQGISVIAITDHWRVSSAKGLIEAAGDRGVVALPGFEANSSEAIHLLVIFEAGTSFDEVNAAIGACGPIPGAPNGTTGNSFAQIVTDMHARGALVIPAHVNVANAGLLHRAKGKALETMIAHPNVHAIGITPSTAAHGDQVKILANTKPYARKHPLVEIYADDVCDPLVLTKPGGSTWFKVSSRTLASLKHAVKTPSTRVRTSDPLSTPTVIVRDISWEGGFLDGQLLPFAQDLTTLIGGRGTGKSTVIESLRYALDISPIGAEAKKDHEAMIRDVLRSGTTVRVHVDVTTPQPATYTIERTVPHPAVVLDSSGTQTKQRPSDIVQGLEVFGQHELAELASDPDRVAEMIARIAGNSTVLAERAVIAQQLADNRDDLTKQDRNEQDLDEELADIPRLEEQAKRFEDTDLAVRLKAQARLNADKAVFDESDERLKGVRSALSAFGADGLVAQLGAEPRDLQESAHAVEVSRATRALVDLADAINVANVALEKAASTAKDELVSARAEWVENSKAEREAHDVVVRALVAEGNNPDEFINTTAQLERLLRKADRRAVLATARADLQGARDTLLKNLADNDKARTAELNGAIRVANKANSAVKVRPIASPDRESIKAVISKHWTGQRTSVMAAIDKADFSPRAFVAAIRSGASQVENLYGIKGVQLTTLMAAGEPLYRNLEEEAVPQAVEVLLNVAPPSQMAQLKKLDELSKGQRATALLLLLLGSSTSPLVVDQPEDDLDNRFVYDGIVMQLRGLKGQRQVIVSTHNANIPVLGDAELVICLEGDGQHGWPAQGGVGSLDAPSIRELAEDVLEGGRTAFDTRQHLYGF